MQIKNLPVVGFVGMSHLSVITSAVMSSFGVKTICFDLDPATISELQNSRTGLSEPGLAELLAETKDKQQFTSNINDLKLCDIIYFASDVATDINGNSDVSQIKKYFSMISKITSKSIFIVLSQVSPGFTRELNDLAVNKIYYQVETLIFGKAIRRSKYPERIIIGDSTGNEPLNQVFLEILELYNCPILVFNYESAEFTKVAINAFLASDVNLSNSLARLSEKIQVNWSNVEQALRLDDRIGKSRYLRQGLGIAGGNIERDLRTISNLSKLHNINASTIDEIIEVNSSHKFWVIDKLNQIYPGEVGEIKVGICGLTYKENTNSIKNSISLFTIENLPDNYQIFIHDPAVNLLNHAGKKLNYCTDPITILKSVQVLMILTPWDEYRNYADPKYIAEFKDKIVIDPYRILDSDLFVNNEIEYFAVGEFFNKKNGYTIAKI